MKKVIYSCSLLKPTETNSDPISERCRPRDGNSARKGTLRALWLMLVFLSTCMVGKATHFAGGEITYEHLTGNTYEVTLRLYRDCAGVNFGSSQNIFLTPTNSGSSMTVFEVSRSDITPLCSTQQSQCGTSSGGSGIQQIIYRANRTFNALPSGQIYTLSNRSCCRNFAITTLVNGGNTSWSISSQLDPNLSPRNSSPTFLNPPVAFVCAGQQATISPNAFDSDGDALQYSLTACLQQTGASVNYQTTIGINASNPLLTSSGFSLDPGTGQLTFTPSQVQVGVVCIRVAEFRNGVKIGEVIRDIQIQVQNCNNTNPVITPIPNQIVQSGTQLCVPVSITDADGDNISASVVQPVSGTFTVTSQGPGFLNGTWCWTPAFSNQGNSYTISINAQDDACPQPGTAQETFTVTVPVPCNVSLSFANTRETCPGANDGSIDLTVNNATLPISYSWTGPNGFTSFAEDISGLEPGIYTVVVVDGNNCAATNMTTVRSTGSPIALSTTTVNESCIGTGDGSITITASGGQAPFTYQLNNGASQSSNVFSGLNAGTYSVKVTDANGCFNDENGIVISSNPNLNASATASNVSCPGSNDGTATASGSGGTPPFTFAWSNGANTASISGLAQGSYTVTVSDVNGCSGTASVNVGVDPDNTAPIIACPANISVNNDAGLCGAIVSYATPQGTDNCPGASTVQTSGLGAGSTFPIGTSTESYQVSDASGNTADCSFTVTVTDAEAPIVTCPANIAVSNDAGMCSAVVAYAVTTSDNCPGASSSQTSGLGSGATFPLGSTTESYTATDAAGNTASCSFTVTVSDTEDPVISCPASISVNNDAGICGALVAYTVPQGIDNCPGASTAQTSGLGSGSTFPVGSSTESFTVTDAAGNTASCSFTVTVTDNEAPAITCPADISVNSDAGLCGAVVSFGLPAVSDNCASGQPTTTLGLGELAFTGYNSDNPDAFSFVLLTDIDAGTIINFTDNGWFASGGFRGGEGVMSWTSSSALAAGSEIQIIGNSSSSGAVSGSLALSTGGDQIFAYQGSLGSPNLISGIQMNGAWDADATSSNTSAQPAGFVDGINSISIAPEADNATYDCSLTSGTAAAVGASVNTAANWNSSGSILALPSCGFSIPSGVLVPTQTAGPASGSIFPVGNTTVSFEVTDPSGNTSTCSFIVTVIDTEAPMLTCPADITQNNDAGICGAAVSYATPVATDNCSQATNPVSQLSAGDIAFTGYNADNPDGWSFVALVDIDANTTIQFTDNGWRAAGGFRTGEGVLAWTTSAVVPAGTEVQIVNNVASIGTAFTLLGSVALSTSGDQLIAFQGTLSNPSLITAIQMNGAWDADATSSNTSALPTGLVDGQNAISISPEIDNAIYDCSTTSGTAMAVRMAVNNAANWNGSGSPVSLPTCNFGISGALTPVLVSGPASGGNFPVGTTTVTWSVTDAAGNSSTCSFDVTVVDAEAPVVSCPANISVNNDAGICGAAVNYTVAFSDNCPGASLAQTSGLGSGATFPVGTSTEVYTATDAAGNSSSCNFTVTVTDNEAPVISCPAAVNVECKSDIPAPDANLASATDNCGVASIVHSGDANNGGSGCAGDPYVVTRTYTATDIYGNTASCTQTLTAMATPIITTTSANAIVFPAYQDSSCADISVVAMGGCPGYTYQWSNGATTAMQNVCPAVTTVYTVTVTDSEGCTGVDSVKVCVIDLACTSQTNNGQGGNGQGGNGQNNGQGNGQGLIKLTICHVPPGNPANAMTKCLSPGAVQAHISQHPGDYLGACGTLASRSCDFGVGSTKVAENEGAGLNEAVTTVRAYPNPFREKITFDIESSISTQAVARIFDASGRIVREIELGSLSAGMNSFEWDGRNVAGTSVSEGIYFARITVGEQVHNVRIALIR